MASGMPVPRARRPGAGEYVDMEFRVLRVVAGQHQERVRGGKFADVSGYDLHETALRAIPSREEAAPQRYPEPISPELTGFLRRRIYRENSTAPVTASPTPTATARSVFSWEKTPPRYPDSAV